MAVEPVAAAGTTGAPPVRHDWKREEIQRIFEAPLMETVYRAATVHRLHHDASRIQLCTLMNIKSTLLGSASLTCSGRMHRGLQVLLPELELQDSHQGVQACQYRACARGGAPGESERLDAILHGRRMA